MGILVVDPQQTQTTGAIPLMPRYHFVPFRFHRHYTIPVAAGSPAKAPEQSPSEPGHVLGLKQPDGSITHSKLGIPQKNQYAAPHICVPTRPTALIAPTRQMTFSPSPTAGRKIRVYVLKAGAVYQK